MGRNDRNLNVVCALLFYVPNERILKRSVTRASVNTDYVWPKPSWGTTKEI
jgi:hypothetical protein